MSQTVTSSADSAIPEPGGVPTSSGEPDALPTSGAHGSRTLKIAILWSYFLTGGGFVVTGVITFVLAALLSPTEFGIWALAMLWVTFAQMLLQHGPAQAVIQREDVTDQHFDAAFWSSLVSAVLLAGLFAGLAPLWADWNDTPELTYFCWALTPAIVLHSLTVIPDAIVRREMRLKSISLRVVTVSLIGGVAGIIAAVAGLGAWSFVVQQLVTVSLTVAVVWTITPWRPRLRGIGPALKDLRRFSAHSVSEFIAFFVSSRADAILMGAFFGPVAVGLYRFALRVTEMVNSLASGGLAQVSLPDLSRLAGDPPAFAARLGKFLHAGAVLALPTFGIVAACAEPLLGIIGPEWVPATAALQVLCAVGATSVLNKILAPAIQAAGRPGVGAALGWVEAAVSAAAVVTVGVLYQDRPPAGQVLAIAVTVLAVQIAFTIANTWVTIRGILGVRLGPVLLPGLPALLSGLTCAAAGIGVHLLVDEFAVVVALLITGGVAAMVAVTVLLLTDRVVARQVGALLRRRRSTAAA